MTLINGPPYSTEGTGPDRTIFDCYFTERNGRQSATNADALISIFTHIDTSTSKIIASLLFTSSAGFTVNHLNVQRQSRPNGEDCVF